MNPGDSCSRGWRRSGRFVPALRRTHSQDHARSARRRPASYCVLQSPWHTTAVGAPASPAVQMFFAAFILRGVDVSVVTGLTTRTVPRPYRQRFAIGDVAALRAAFGRREPAVDFHNHSTCFLGLVLDHSHELRPTGITDRPSQIPILLHPLHVQALQSDDLPER